MADVFETEIKSEYPSADEYDEVTTMKTEVVEESYEFKATADTEFVNVKEEHCSSPEDAGEEENFKPEADIELSTNENLGEPFYKTKTLKEDHNGLDTKWCEENKEGLDDWEDVAVENGKKFQCDDCGYVTNDRPNFARHASAHRDSPKQFKCETCGNSFRRTSQLAEHVKTHDSSDRREKVACPHCDNSYYRKTTLTQHINIKHKGHRRFRCDECGYTTAYNTLLKRHMTAKHGAGEKRFKCPHCAHSTHYKANLEKHVRIHSNAKVFKCGSCEYATVDKSSLRKHTLVKHSGQPKKYNCGDCIYSTHIKGHLVRHLRNHADKKPYKCDHENCNYNCGSRGQLTKHAKQHHA